MAIENGGMLRIVWTQNCEGSEPVRELYRLLKAEVPETEFADRGLQTFDGFYLEHMETVG